MLRAGFCSWMSNNSIRNLTVALGMMSLENSKAMTAISSDRKKRGCIIFCTEIPADLSATISYRSPILPKVISDANSTAKGNAIEVSVMEA